MNRAALGLICLLLTACGAPGSLFAPQSTMPTFRDERMSVQDAASTIAIGKSRRADVRAALGSATVVRFDSGYEVWVYRFGKAKTLKDRGEFVLLFTPQGVVSKMRVRPPSA